MVTVTVTVPPHPGELPSVHWGTDTPQTLPPAPGPHQDELPIVGQLPGPACLGPFTLQQPLLTHHLVLARPLGQTLRGVTVTLGTGGKTLGETPSSPRQAGPSITATQRWMEPFVPQL